AVFGSTSARHTLFRGSLRTFRAVLGARLLPAGHSSRVHCSAHNVIADTRQILDAAAADQHNRVLLEVMADSWNIGRDFDTVGEPYAGHLPQSRIRLFRRGRIHASAQASALG